MEAQKVTVFAPKTITVPGFQPLPDLQKEINAIVRHHDATVFGEVRRFDPLAAASEAERPNIMHFAGHLTENGFVGSSEFIPLSTILGALQSAEPQLAFFNVCDSLDLAERLASQSATDCVASTTDVEDTIAVDFATLFYSVLRRDDVTSYRQAFVIVDAQDGIFRYIKAGRKPRLTNQSQDKPRMDELARQISMLNQSIYELRARLDAEIAILKERDATQQRLIDAIHQQIAASDRYSAAQLKSSLPAEVKISAEMLLRIGIAILVVALVIILAIWLIFWRGS